jgi:hypothetical protein
MPTLRILFLCISFTFSQNSFSQNQDITGKWTLDSVHVKKGWIKKVLYDTLDFNSNGKLIRTIRFYNNTNARFLSPTDTCPTIDQWKFHLKKNKIKLSDHTNLKCCSMKCVWKIKNMGTYKKNDNVLIIQTDYFDWYYRKITN